MSKKIIIRILVWLTLTLGLSVITYLNYQIFIVDSIKNELEYEEQNKVIIERQLSSIESKISEYNKNIYEDNRYLLFIPKGLNKSELILDYINVPIEKVGAKLISPITLTDEMPNNINWSNNANNIKGVKVSIIIDIPFSELVTYIDELQNTVRCIYFGDIKYSVPNNLTANTEVNIEYYLFYQQ